MHKRPTVKSVWKDFVKKEGPKTSEINALYTRKYIDVIVSQNSTQFYAQYVQFIS